jgi:hypothetical protein
MGDANIACRLLVRSGAALVLAAASPAPAMMPAEGRSLLENAGTPAKLDDERLLRLMILCEGVLGTIGRSPDVFRISPDLHGEVRASADSLGSAAQLFALARKLMAVANDQMSNPAIREGIVQVLAAAPSDGQLGIRLARLCLDRTAVLRGEAARRIAAKP